MWRPNISNRIFDRMGERYAPVIDPYHFLGRNALDWPGKREYTPPVNLRKTDQLFILEIAVPGFEKNDIEITVSDDLLKIRGEKGQQEASVDAEVILEEFTYNSFERSFRLAKGLGHEQITATLEAGVLRLEFVDVPEDQEKTHQKIQVQ